MLPTRKKFSIMGIHVISAEHFVVGASPRLSFVRTSLSEENLIDIFEDKLSIFMKAIKHELDEKYKYDHKTTLIT